MAMFAVFVHRGDGRYHLQDAIGARVWKREKSAQAFCDEQNNDKTAMAVNPSGYVVRSSDWYSSNGVEITANGRVYMK